MKILITGGSGFIGKHVIRQIQADRHDILVMSLERDNNDTDSNKIQWLYGDLKKLQPLKTLIESFNAEVVIHLAWQGIPDYSEAISMTNLLNSIQLFDFILKETNCQKVMVSGSCFEYGGKRGICNESDPVTINSFFSWAKYSLYQYLLLKCRRRAVDLIWFRIFYVYGPCQRSGSLIPTLVQALRNEKQPDIRSPLNKNDFIYVEDVAKAFQLAAVTGLNTGIYNLGCGYSVSVYDACKIAENYILGSSRISNDIIHIGSKSESIDFWADMEKTTSALNWTPNITFEQGVAKYIESIKNEKRQ